MGAKIRIKNLPEGYQSIITNGKHSIVGDEPIKSNGTDLGLAPTELLLASLAMCKVATVRYIARKNDWTIGNVEAELSERVKRNPDRTLETKVDVQIKIEGELTDDQRATLLSEADNCYVHRMIEGKWDIAQAQEIKAAEVG